MNAPVQLVKGCLDFFIKSEKKCSEWTGLEQSTSSDVNRVQSKFLVTKILQVTSDMWKSSSVLQTGMSERTPWTG